MDESNPWNSYFDDSPFYDDQRLITGQWLYWINDDTVERSNNGSTVDIYTNIM